MPKMRQRAIRQRPNVDAYQQSAAEEHSLRVRLSWDENRMNTDRNLAYFAYAHFVIPRSDWEEHYKLDSYHDSGWLMPEARSAYRQIWRSIEPQR